MSIKEPGIMFDATNSWNGYNHQGKIALWYALGEIIKLIDPSLSQSLNRQNLEKYFLEIEYMEDFSVGEKLGESLQYHSVHQVKDREDTSVDAYESALLGLVKHMVDDSDISEAYLHLSSDLELGDKPLSMHLAAMIENPKHLASIERAITTNRSVPEYRNSFLMKKKGRPTKLKSELLHALSKVCPKEQYLTESNLDNAFDELLREIDERKRLLKRITQTQLSHINIYRYSVGNTKQHYCRKDQAKVILKQQIMDFYITMDPQSYKVDPLFVEKSYLYVLGKLDQHIVDRSLNYEAYKKGQLERQISFATIFEWLLSDEIERLGDEFYIYHIKERFFRMMDDYCKVCSKKMEEHCLECQVPLCKDKLGTLSFRQLREFLNITNPHICGSLNVDTFAEYTSTLGINNPFLTGLRDLPQRSIQNEERIAVTYQDIENLQYALTAIAPRGTDDDKAIICSEIIKNRNVYGLLMDYDCLISNGIDVKSIQDEEITQSYRHDSKMSEHIVHCKNVKIVPLATCNENHLFEKEPIEG